MTFGTLDFDGDAWLVSDLKPHVSIRFKDMFKGVRFGSRPPFLLKDRQDRAFDLHWFMSRYPLDMTPRAAAAIEGGVSSYRAARAKLDAMARVDYVPSLITGFRAPEEARPHQMRAAEMLRMSGRLLLLDDVGLGKTVSALAAVADGWGLPAAVVVQPHLSTQWVKQYIERFTHLTAYEVKDRNARILPPADIYLFRYSNIAAWVDYVEPLGIKTTIFDEIQELRHGRGTDKGRGAMAFRDASANVLGLTATPIYNYGSEIWNVVEFVAPGALGTWDEFIVNWCASHGSHWIVKDPEALGAFLQDEGISLRRTDEDEEVAMSLPPLAKTVFEVGWNEGDAETDRELQRRLALRVLQGGFTERGEAARQLDLMVRQETGVAKARSVAAYVRTLVEAGEPVLLGGWHREVYRIWNEALADLNPVMFTGSESQPQKRAAREALLSGASKILIMSLRSGSGLDGLQDVIAHAVIGELDWSPQVHRQFIGRIRRDGQKRPVTAHYLHVDGGSDPVILPTLGLKASQSHGILNPYGGATEATPVDETRMRQLARSILNIKEAG
ncbi:DEAD/DEAH box helicase [Falsirhodobacter halotolerans]|uniref:SNF2-related protein n=1 Tax=Falsirhodobacter halotolerans TaxID=1146892 RepID=UPI001FD4E6A0|nr:DEAD/DEAH box helicase [Falsirhodobacter halotolerans]MCJ8139598.1 DEAD/DEAH box helicase [Falsirhodobacter halotolerans]